MATLTAATVWMVGCNGGASKIKEIDQATILPVKVTQVVRRTEFTYPLNYYGRVKAVRESALAFELAGQVSAMLVDEGDQIREGQPLANLNTEILAAQRKLLVAKKAVEESLLKRLVKGERPEVIDAAQAAVERLRIEVKRALINEQREQKLLQTKSISESRYEQLKYDYESLRFSLKEAQAHLAELESGPREEDIEAQENRVAMQDAEISVLDTRMEKATLYAPFAGQVIERIIDGGTVVDAGQAVLVVSGSGEYEARFSLPVTQLAQLVNIQTVVVGNRQIPVKGYRVVSNVDPSTRTVDVVFVLEPTTDLIAGESCNVEMTQTIKKNCVEMPVDALIPSIRGLWSCYRVVPDAEGSGYQVTKEEVTIEHTDGDRVFVVTDLPDDALIASEGVHKLVPGMQVQPMGEMR
jgi:multidrug efflux pump subunit AcrA (membrane-fusion protein)